MKEFNTTGHCNSARHYMIEASTRLHGVEELIDDEKYFVIHAARQSGKTTYLQDLSGRLNAGGKYYALYCSLEKAQNVVEPERGIPVIYDCITLSLQKTSAIPYVYDESYERDKKNRPLVLLTLFLMNFVKSLDKPLVILFDEADCLSEGTLISFLRQLRDGYNDRSITPFVHSVALVGMRNIRDYKVRIRPESETLGSASPFNIIAEALTIQNFTKEEVVRLYRQHTDETGQIFEDDAIELAWEQTQGQPWLVNAIAREVIVKILKSDCTKPVTAELVSQAIQNIILTRPTHIDSLLERLKEDRVRRVIEPMIIGEGFVNKESEDFLYTRDLGLIRVENSQIKPANPIYAEVIIRKLSSSMQETLQNPKYPYQIPRYLKPDGDMDVDYLMRDFQKFWHLNSGVWLEMCDYPEAGPLLVMMAFLQRVVNGGGQIIRDMASGNGRLDLMMIYNGKKYPIELKIRYGKKYLEDGLDQTSGYMDLHCCDEGWMVVFDRRSTVKWEDKLYMKKETVDGKTVTIVGA
ncbi:MAG: AAA-like domain-containing protein [Tannerella sp.]|jgi:AAA+ ATPase superfamily predicted ATPase|nr:AAA-like domain-containing protein [Tannerella sp.]